MAKKFRKIITLVLVAAMALSLCGISAMAVDEGNQGPTAKTMIYDGNPFTVYITCNGEPLTEEVSLSLEYDYLIDGWGSTDHTATTSTGSNTFYVIGTRQYRAVASWNGMTVTSGPVYVDFIVGDSVTINFDLTYTIAASATNGTIDPSGDATVAYGGDQAFTYSADTGYELQSVLVDGIDVTASYPDSYTFTTVTADHSIAVSYQEQEQEQEPDTDPVDEVIITVEDTEGNPIEGAHVTLTGPTSPAPQGDTDASGQITFTDSVVGYSSGSNTSEYSIAVTKTGYVDGSGTVTVTDDWFVEGQWSYGDSDVFGHGNATVVLPAETPPEPETETVQFYIERLGQIRDTTSGGVAGRPAEDFSNCILSQETTVTLYQIAGDSTTDASAPDFAVRALLPGQYPSDETVFNFLKAESDSAKKPTTTLDGVAIDYANLDTANYTVQWYVLKDQGVWHVDGVIVTKAQENLYTDLCIVKTFSGIEDLPSGFQITVSDGESTVATLTTANGIRNVQEGVYTWTVVVPCGTCIVTETGAEVSGYTLDADYGVRIVTETVAEVSGYTLDADYGVRDDEFVWHYDNYTLGTGIEVKASEAGEFMRFINKYTENSEPPVGSSYYTLTVNWVDGEGSPLADPETESVLAYSGYNAANVEGGSDRAFEGYTYSALAEGSDDVSGTMNGNKTVTFVYAAEEDIPEETPPLNPEPTEEVPDDDVPLDSSPKTGDNTQIALLWLLFFASFSGLVVMAITAPKKRTEKH